jgi:hypothetical protein|tara:strand:+ start:1064 stop:1366 length:303 start_codon:yes stop_codon:yes gene_type:complete
MFTILSCLLAPRFVVAPVVGLTRLAAVAHQAALALLTRLPIRVFLRAAQRTFLHEYRVERIVTVAIAVVIAVVIVIGLGLVRVACDRYPAAPFDRVHAVS